MSEEPEELRLRAYYYGFDATGDPAINLILSAVACAGKAYHSTSWWTDETPAYDDRFKGETPEEWIQNAANDAARRTPSPAVLALATACRRMMRVSVVAGLNLELRDALAAVEREIGGK